MFVALWMALMGGILTVVLIAGAGSAPVVPVWFIGDDVPTSFGSITVTDVQRLVGLDAAALAGAVHGINGLVQQGDNQIQVFVRFNGSQSGSTYYSPSQFKLFSAARTDGVEPVGASLGTGLLRPGWTVDGSLHFVIPADGSALRLRFTDPDRGATIDIGVGTTATNGEPGAAPGAPHPVGH
jgi:hypothetical protein